MDAATPDSAQDIGRQAARTRLGMWAFLGSEVMFFGPVFFAYLYGRFMWPQAFEAASRGTDLLCGAVNTAVLLTSSLGVAVAHLLADRGAYGRARRVLDAVVLLGLAFLAIKGYEYVQDWREQLVPGPYFHVQGAVNQAGAQLFYFVYFFATALHALHLTAGIALMLHCRRALLRRPGRPTLRRLEAAGLYWHFVDIVWIFLFPALYLAGRAL